MRLQAASAMGLLVRECDIAWNRKGGKSPPEDRTAGRLTPRLTYADDITAVCQRHI